MNIRFLFIILIFLNCKPYNAVNLRYNENGPLVFSNLPITWSFSCAFPDQYHESVRNGFNYWNKVLSREAFREDSSCGIITPGTVEYPKLLVVYFPTANPDKADILATADIGTQKGIPVSAVIKYYSTWANAKSQKSLESVSRHEAGHVLGLGHSDYERCLMYPTIPVEKQVWRAKSLCSEEIREIQSLY